MGVRASEQCVDWIRFDDENVGRLVPSPPAWDASFYAIYRFEDVAAPDRSASRSAIEPKQIVRLNPIEILSKPTLSLPELPSPASVFAAVGEVLRAPSGWVEPWIVRIGYLNLVSLALPEHLLDAPSGDEVPLSVASQDESEIRLRCRRWAEDRVCTPSPDFFDVLTSADLREAIVHWFAAQRWISSRPCTSARALAECLRNPPPTSTGHLIAGLEDRDGVPLY